VGGLEKGASGSFPSHPMEDRGLSMVQLGMPGLVCHVTLFARSVTAALPQARLSCYIRAMKKFVFAAFLLMLFAVPAIAAKHKVTHPKPVHVQNPYLSHPNHKAHRQHHKKI